MKLTHKLLPILLTLVILTACAPAAAPAPAPTGTAAPAMPTDTLAPTVPPSPTDTAAPTNTAAPAVIQVSDGMSGSLTLAQPAQRIVSLAPSNSEIVFAVGAGKQMVAREDFTNYPPEAADLPSVGGNMGKVNMETLVSLKPDLVLASPLTAPESIKSMQDLKLPVLMVNNPTTLDGMYANLELVGKVTGHDAEAKALVEKLQAQEKKIAGVVAQATGKPLVFYELDATEPAKPWTSGPGTFIDLLINLAGGQNVGAELKSDWVQISQEELIVRNPDVILLGDAKYGASADQVSQRAGWSAIKAVKEKKIFAIDDDMVSRPGPRLLDGLLQIVQAIHPELADQLK
jgi:iron complex transport system substrate-binding protein